MMFGLEEGERREDLIRALYVTFARYTAEHPLVGCPCCVGAQDQRSIHGPLRELSAEALSRYSAKAMSTWGTATTFKYFVPRILELLGSSEATAYHGFDAELIAGKLTYAAWRMWRPEEQALITRYFQALWLASLDGTATPAPAEMVRAIRALGEEIGPWLAHWDPMRSPRAAEELGFLVMQHHRRDKELRLWLHSPARLRALEASFEAHIETPQADNIAAAADHLRWKLM